MRVLLSVAPPDGTTKFVDQLTHAPDADVKYEYFSWRRALSGDYDVFHVHWPEQIVRGRRPWRSLLNLALTHLLIFKLRRRQIPLVRTLHNRKPHDRLGILDGVSYRALARREAAYIHINATVDKLSPPHFLVLHGHYVERFSSYRREETVRGRLAYAGLIKEYKQVPHLISTFSRVGDPELRLSVVGKAQASLQEQLRKLAERDQRVDLNLSFVTDEELVRELSMAELVVLPYTEMANSGMMLVALSLAKPVLVPHSAVASGIAAEVGPGWVHSFTGELSPDDLRRCLTEVRSRPTRTASPNLGGRDWDEIGRLHAQVYRWSLAHARRR